MVARTVRDREVVGSNPAAPTIFLRKTSYFVVAYLLEYLGAAAPLRTVYFASSRLEIRRFSLKNHTATKTVGNPPTIFLRKTSYFVVAYLLEYPGAAAPLRTVYFASSRLEIRRFSLKNIRLQLPPA